MDSTSGGDGGAGFTNRIIISSPYVAESIDGGVSLGIQTTEGKLPVYPQ
jgi:hypothetical protein